MVLMLGTRFYIRDALLLTIVYMGLFGDKKADVDELAAQRFWDWFKNNRDGGILSVVREMNVRLQGICGMDADSFWYDLGYEPQTSRGTLVFWADEDPLFVKTKEKCVRSCLKRLIELAPADVKEKWDLSVMIR